MNMRLTPKKIEQILITILGEEGLPLIKELMSKDNTSEFDLATKTKKDIKVIRKWLYILYNHNLVSFTRKKDKIKGWYIYYWTLVPNSVKFSYFKMKRDLLEKLKLQIDEEKRELFFACSQRCLRMNFDNAMDFEFRCPECGELVNQDNSEEIIKNLHKQIGELEIELKELREVKKEKRKKIKEIKKKKKLKKKQKLKEKKVKQKKEAKSIKGKVKKVLSKILKKNISKKKDFKRKK